MLAALRISLVACVIAVAPLAGAAQATPADTPPAKAFTQPRVEDETHFDLDDLTISKIAFRSPPRSSTEPAVKSEPAIKSGMPYPAARRQLIAQGFDPVKILHRHGDINGPDCRRDAIICRAYPELESCAGDAPKCAFLYRRRSDGGYWLIFTEGELAPRARDLNRLQYAGGSAIPRSDLDGLTILLPNGKRHTIHSPGPASMPTSICSAAIRTDCWVKPPPGWKPPASRSGGL